MVVVMTRDRSKSKARGLSRTFVWYSFGTACSVALTLGVLFAAQDDQLDTREILSAIGLNLIASVVFALMFVALANWVQERSVHDTIRDGFSELADRVAENMTATNRLFIPLKKYEALNPSDTYGDEYNRDVTHDLEETNFFAFYGPSARYVAARLLAARHHPQQVRIAMIGPGNVRAIRRRAYDRRSWAKPEGLSVDKIQEDLRNELIVNLVALFECRQICPIEILFNDDTAVYRYVMLDKAVYVSWYHSPHSAQMEMPESYRFGRESFVYSTFRMDLMRRFEISSDKVLFEANQDDRFLLDTLRRITGEAVTETELGRWRAEHLSDSASFSAYMDKLYANITQKDA
ncbi:hypothetical protein ALI144C_15105 [Actinosynnema sp. ALI-1.44]|nr:hypothetical protein ALI144C_15105 [Actinosynnema sp. ALI-1.44]